jgi:polyisoprenoid-binding protein YceI
MSQESSAEARRATEVAGKAASAAVRAVVRTGDGWPVPGAVLTVIDGSGTQVARVQGDGDGAATAVGLPRGTYTAIMTAAGYQPVARTAFLPENQSADLGVIELQRMESRELPAPGLWRIDPAHSSISVSAQHLGITSVHGRFKEFGGTIRIGSPIESSIVDVRINSASIDTANADRDEHLRSPDFLDVQRFPAVTFTSAQLRPRAGQRWDLDGELTLCGVRRPTTLDTRFVGVSADPWGGTRASATATTRLRKDDYAMTFNQSLADGIMMIGSTLRVELDIQAVRVD